MENNKEEKIIVDGEETTLVSQEQHLPKEVVLPDQTHKLEDFLNVLLLLRTTIKTVSSAPTYVPRHFLEQVVLYSSGGTYRLYFHLGIDGWRYVALT